MIPGVSEALLVYGPLGMMVLVGFVVSRKLFSLLSTERKEHMAKVEALTTGYANEVKKLNEDHQRSMAEQHATHAQKAEEWMKGYHDLSNSLKDSLDTLMRRLRRED